VYRVQFIPYNLRLVMKLGCCRALGRIFKTLPDLAAAIVRILDVAEEMRLRVEVLFDAGYMRWTYVKG
jgi:hypothetical protein